MDNPRPRDSRMKSFLLRARTILAAERGMNEKSRIKLRALAEDLQLPQVLFESAISQLQEGTAALDGELTRYEKQFVKWLEKHLEPLAGHVLTPAHEEKAIQRGTREFQIAEDRARDLVRQAAILAGVGRVSRLDATGHVALLVDEAIGYETTANSTVRQRLVEMALSWGVEPAQTAALINNRLEANRQAAKPVRPAWMIVVAAVASIAVVVLLILFFLKQTARTTGERGGTDAKTSPAAPKDTSADAPAEWSEPLRKAWKELLAQDRELAVPRSLVVSGNPDEHRDAVRQMVDFSLTGPDGRRRAFSSFLELWFRENPAIKRCLLEELVDRLTPSAPELTVRSSEQAFRAIEQLELLQSASNTGAVMSALESGLPASFADQGEISIAHVRAELVRKIWGQLDGLIVRYPDEAARKFGPLLELTRSQSPDAGRLAWNSGLKLFRSEGEHWQLIRDSWQSTFSKMTPDQIFQAYDSLTQMEDVDRRGWLLPLLAAKAGIQGEGLTLAAMETGLRSSLGLTESLASPAARRLELLMSLPDFAASKSAGPAENDPQAIANTAWLSTSAFLLWRATVANDPKLLELFDELVASGPQSLSDPERNGKDWQSLPVYGKTLRRPSPPDIEARRDVFENLAPEKKTSPEGRASAIERLAEISGLFADLTPEQSSLLADVLLNARETPEVVAVEQYGERFAHWPTLAMAVAERLLIDPVSLDQALTVTHLLTGKRFYLSPAKPEDWKRDLYREFLQRIADGLQYTAEQQGVDTRYRWDGLSRYLMELGRIRCLAAGVPATKSEKASTPAELVRLVLQHFGVDDSRIESCHLLSDDQLQEQILLTDLLGQFVKERNGIASGTSPEAGLPRPEKDFVSCPPALHLTELQLLEALVQAAGAR
jgi:hypothetical protein